MRVILIAISTILFSFTTISDNTTDRLGVKGPLEFSKTKYHLAWTNKPNENYYVQEYLPEKEKVEHFNQMLTIHLFITDLTAKDAVLQKVKELDERRKTDKVCKYTVNESPDSKEFMTDFLLSESKDDKVIILEFNIYRYKQIEISNNKKAIVVYAYSKRSYGDDIPAFFRTIKQDRISYLNEMISTAIPVISLDSK